MNNKQHHHILEQQGPGQHPQNTPIPNQAAPHSKPPGPHNTPLTVCDPQAEESSRWGPMALLLQVSNADREGSQDTGHPQDTPQCPRKRRQRKTGSQQGLPISPSHLLPSSHTKLSCIISLYYHLIEIQVIPFHPCLPGSPGCFLPALKAWQETP